MESGKIPEDGRRRRDRPMFLFTPSPLSLPSLLSRKTLQFYTLKQAAKPLIAFEDTEVINTIASCEVEEDKREDDLLICPTLGFCMKLGGYIFPQIQDSGQVQIDGKTREGCHACIAFFFFILVRENTLWHNSFTSLMIVLFG
jgi:hypothetical protein